LGRLPYVILLILEVVKVYFIFKNQNKFKKPLIPIKLGEIFITSEISIS